MSRPRCCRWRSGIFCFDARGLPAGWVLAACIDHAHDFHPPGRDPIDYDVIGMRDQLPRARDLSRFVEARVFRQQQQSPFVPRFQAFSSIGVIRTDIFDDIAEVGSGGFQPDQWKYGFLWRVPDSRSGCRDHGVHFRHDFIVGNCWSRIEEACRDLCPQPLVIGLGFLGCAYLGPDVRDFDHGILLRRNALGLAQTAATRSAMVHVCRSRDRVLLCHRLAGAVR